MINQVNKRSTIGIKRLSPADLGTSSTSNQTHIGLLEGTLNFIEAEHQIISSLLIYNNQITELLSFLDFIENSDGSFRSPKIRKGKDSELVINGLNINSVVREIRQIVNINESPLNWFLLWFGLNTNELVFHLFNDQSEDFQEIKQLVGQIGNHKQVENTSTKFSSLINYLNQKVAIANLEYYEELETSYQTNSEMKTRKVMPRIQDIEQANKLFKETGIKGEELLYKYLELQKTNDVIKDFKWVNQSRETGLPYDFEITSNNNSLIYSDAKATRYKFELPIILSAGELSFINENKDNYLIHRMYSVFDEPKLRVCKNISNISDIFIPNHKVFDSSLRKQKLLISGVKLAVPTNIEILTFEEEVLLGKI